MNNFPRNYEQVSGYPPLTEIITPPRIEFIEEQDGGDEEKFKNFMRNVYTATKFVRRAYFVRASFGEPPVSSVILCERHIERIEEDLKRGSKHMFGEIRRLPNFYDKMIIDEEQEQELRKVCKPFCEAG